MTDYALPCPPVPSVAIRGSSARLPVRRIFCVGRNYLEHIRELGNDEREPPFFFTKPADALVADGATIPYPPATQDLHHEAELVVAIGTGGAFIPREAALGHVWGYAPGNDLTRRDVQNAAKAARRPWDMSKAFDLSAVCGAVVPVAECGHPQAGAIRCAVDGADRQAGDLSEMIWPVADIVSALSTLVRLEPGDLIFTGTPSGVGPLVPGQSCTVTIEGLGAATVTIAA